MSYLCPHVNDTFTEKRLTPSSSTDYEINSWQMQIVLISYIVMSFVILNKISELANGAEI